MESKLFWLPLEDGDALYNIVQQAVKSSVKRRKSCHFFVLEASKWGQSRVESTYGFRLTMDCNSTAGMVV